MMPSRISAFTVIRNAEVMGYPVKEAILSILPIVDEYIVAVGSSDDDTRALIESIDSDKIRIVDTTWDTGRNRGGLMLSEKTNEALAMCTGDWCFYLQADEVVHERDLAAIRSACDDNLHDVQVEALLFQYLHFYGSFGVVATARNWYRHEVRIVRNHIGARSIGDAQSFCVGDHKPRVKRSNATVHHYGWVKPPERMIRKQRMFGSWYNGGQTDDGSIPTDWSFRQLYGLRRFTGEHPATVRQLVESQDWTFEPRFAPRDWTRKDWKNFLSDGVEWITRRRWGERRKYVLLKP